MKVVLTMCALLSLGACANFGSYVGNPVLAADAEAVNNDLLALKADYAAHASVTVIAADSARLVADSAKLDADVKAAGAVPA